jgi:ATP-dependent protease ClpP protease subunit
MTAPLLTPPDFACPAVTLAGPIDNAMYDSFRAQFANAPREGLVVVEVSTLGGDPEVARIIGEDVRFESQIAPARRIVFLGKAAVYSAGVTLMSWFARENRYLTHERQHSGALTLSGSLTGCLATVRAKLNELEASIAIQNEGFQNLINGSSVSYDDILRHAAENWYLEAQEAQSLGLIEAVI